MKQKTATILIALLALITAWGGHIYAQPPTAHPDKGGSPAYERCDYTQIGTHPDIHQGMFLQLPPEGNHDRCPGGQRGMSGQFRFDIDTRHVSDIFSEDLEYNVQLRDLDCGESFELHTPIVYPAPFQTDRLSNGSFPHRLRIPDHMGRKHRGMASIPRRIFTFADFIAPGKEVSHV